jgi:signal transduction histidine kinase
MNKLGSLKLRLMLAAGFGISLSLLIAGLSFYVIFQRYVERAAISELQNHFIQLAASIRLDDTGLLKARTSLSDPRFQKPYGGLYWQINELGQTPLRSRSLFDETLPVPSADQRPDPTHDMVHIIPGPESSTLFALEKAIVLPLDSGIERKLNITMAVDRHDIDETVSAFGHDLAKGLALLYVALFGGAFLQTYFGLRPLELLRQKVETVRLGTAHNISGNYPNEVASLVDEVNGLLDSRDSQMVRARQRASNLAHGLKTPLTVMAAIADGVEASGQKHHAKDIRDGADQMRMLVERELARARMASGHTGKFTEVAPIVNRMMNALKKTSDQDSLLWHSNVPATATLAMETEDLLECVGNLLENARKWAKSQIYISWQSGILKVEDDGPGVPDEQIAKILERGVRLDASVSGSGLGLAIVNDLTEIYGLDLKLQRSSLGGLSVAIGGRR